MTTDRKKQLETHRSALFENMNPKAVINRLCSHQFLTVREAEISRAGGTADQSEKLLDCLLGKPDTAFEIVRDARRRTGPIHAFRATVRVRSLYSPFLTTVEHSG